VSQRGHIVRVLPAVAIPKRLLLTVKVNPAVQCYEVVALGQHMGRLQLLLGRNKGPTRWRTLRKGNARNCLMSPLENEVGDGNEVGEKKSTHTQKVEQ
jgi:hypothetical protein